RTVRRQSPSGSTWCLRSLRGQSFLSLSLSFLSSSDLSSFFLSFLSSLESSFFSSPLDTRTMMREFAGFDSVDFGYCETTLPLGTSSSKTSSLPTRKPRLANVAYAASNVSPSTLGTGIGATPLEQTRSIFSPLGRCLQGV